MDGGIGVFPNWRHDSRGGTRVSGEAGLLLTCYRNVGILFSTKQGNRLSRVEEGENGALLELCHETPCSSVVGTCISGIFLRYIKGVLYSFAFQDATWDSSRDTALE